MTGDAGRGGIHANVVYSILTARERRAILQDLAVAGASASISGLIQRVADREDGPGGRDDQAIGIRLHHQHLPKMAEAGVVEYDRDNGRVTLTETGRRVEAVSRRTAALLGIE